MSDDKTERCAKCGTEFAASSSPLGICPSCLFKLGMSDPAMAPAQTPPTQTSGQEPEPEIVATIAPPIESPAARRLRLPSRLVWIATAALLAIGVVATTFSRFLLPSRPAISAHVNPVRFSLPLPNGTDMSDAAQVAVSPDGTQVVVAARRHDRTQSLWLRRLQSLEWRELPRTDRATFPFWSPDGRHIGFFAGSRLMRIDIGGDLTQTICDVDNGRGGTWSREGVIVFAGVGGLFRVPAPGGTPEPVTQLDRGRARETAHLRPQFLPGGRRVMFLARTVSERAGETYLLDLDTGEPRLIANGPATFAGGLLLFSRGSTLAAQEFDDARGSLVGNAQTVAGIEAMTSDLSAFSASSTVLVFHRQEPRRRQLLWFDRQGGVIGAEDDNVADVEGFALSPDGRSLAIVRREAGRDTSSIWLMELGSRRVTRLASSPGRDESPVWSPDGSRLAVTSDRGENQGVHIVVRDLNGKEETLFEGPDAQLTDWSRDGRLLIYSARSSKTRSDLWMLPVTGDRKPQVLDQTPANESQGTLSPDGRLIAYVSDESGADEIYVRPFPPSEGRWQVSSGGGTRPRWRFDGRELMFLSPAGEVMSVEIELAATPRFGATQQLLDAPRAEDFVVSGPRFLALMPVEQAGDRQLEVILNWATEVRR